MNTYNNSKPFSKETKENIKTNFKKMLFLYIFLFTNTLNTKQMAFIDFKSTQEVVGKTISTPKLPVK